MKIKTSELNGVALDWAVAKCEGREPSYYMGRMRATAHPDFPGSPPMFGPELNYSTDWSQGGPIIEREKMQLWVGQNWNASMESNNVNPDNFESGPTPLIAAMRCYVASQLGDEVEVPDCLIEANHE